jgi:hypothetical protein
VHEARARNLDLGCSSALDCEHKPTQITRAKIQGLAIDLSSHDKITAPLSLGRCMIVQAAIEHAFNG